MNGFFAAQNPSRGKSHQGVLANGNFVRRRHIQLQMKAEFHFHAQVGKKRSEAKKEGMKDGSVNSEWPRFQK
ncbi:hypothetical protein CEXT_384331 [Caerostris extrusa]|uniref:Uncharacterized protein n=1 Tax=Caerostris extrusa TaxID=172846 RepID=A0AAV4WTL2_CAEEX|nr:hypothetical protein CEXT_384331 [Caerostris extrusa]